MMAVRMLTLAAQRGHRLPADSAQHRCPLSRLSKQLVATIDVRI